MSSSEFAAVDGFLSEDAREFVESLSPEDQATVERAIESLMNDPRPDNVHKFDLAGLFAPDIQGQQAVRGYSGEGFWLTYAFDNAQVLNVLAIDWMPEYGHRDC